MLTTTASDWRTNKWAFDIPPGQTESGEMCVTSAKTRRKERRCCQYDRREQYSCCRLLLRNNLFRSNCTPDVLRIQNRYGSTLLNIGVPNDSSWNCKNVKSWWWTDEMRTFLEGTRPSVILTLSKVITRIKAALDDLPCISVNEWIRNLSEIVHFKIV